MQKPGRLALVLLGLLILLGGPSLVRFYTDWLWFNELGYGSVFLTMLRSQGTLFTIGFVAAFAWLAVNLRVATSTMSDIRAIITTREGLEITLPGRQQLRTLALGVAAALALLIGLFTAGRWTTWLAWRYAVPFGEADPVLGHDIGFYVFSLPFWQFANGLAQALVAIAALASAGLYLLSGSLGARARGRFAISATARRHLALLGAVFLVLLAVGAWLQRAEHLVTPGGMIHGASYADVNGRMPANLLLVAACLAGAGLALLQAFGRRNWPIPVAIGLYLLVSIGGEIYSTLLQRFVVAPNEQTREAPFIAHNIAATRRAYGLDAIEPRDVSGDALLTREDIANNAATLENVRLWDHEPLLETFGQLQEIRTYYDFVSVDNDRYRIDGGLRQIMLSPRELNSASLPNRTWINERLTFTHGYGLTLGPVNEVTSQGLPVLFVRDLPPETTTAELQVSEPSLYFGEVSNDYVIVRTGATEFHYPRGDDNVYTQYEGAGGVPIGSLWRRLLFAIRFGAYQIVLSNDINAESRILFNRRISDRVRVLAGTFLSFDQDPYLVLVDGRLYWIYDAYTTSALYPYSTPAGRLNYIRNSVKFVIDAYDGTTTAYLADDSDPVVATYARIFPALFRPLDEMPAGLRAHVRYPEDIFAIQAQVYSTYHMTQPSVFYNREDQWEIPVIDEAGEGRAMQPYYTVMRLPLEPDPEFIQMLPFTPRGRENLSAWLVARSDGEHYGKLRVFVFPKQSLVFGPRQIVSRIRQDQVISPQITLWSQQGSQVIWGTLMVIPIEESLIYVRPLYLRASGGRIPELTRVVVAYREQIVMEETLDAALARLFGGPAPGAAEPELERVSAAPEDSGAESGGDGQPAAAAALAARRAALAEEARGHYARAIEAQRAGDWARYGEEIRALGDVLERMAR